MNMYEKFVPVIHRDNLTIEEVIMVNELVDLADSPIGYFLRKENGSIVNALPGDTFAAWGGISGTLANQTDLQLALDSKFNLNQNNPQHVIGAPIFDALQFNTSYVGPAIAEGELRWNPTDGTLDLGMSGGDIIQQIGQEIFQLIKNQTGATILNGRPVMFAGAVGASGILKGQYAIADGSIPAIYTIGVATQDIANGTDGYITTFGKVRGIDTTGTPYGEVWADGDIIYVSPTTAGYLTNVAPQAPDLQITIAAVVNAHAIMGTLFIRPTWRSKITDLDDVNGTALTTDGQFPTWHNTAGYFDFDKNINNYFYKPGLAGGQTAIGGTGSGENLTLQSTSHATKGKILFGTSAYDEVNNRLGVGTDTPLGKIHGKASVAFDLTTIPTEQDGLFLSNSASVAGVNSIAGSIAFDNAAGQGLRRATIAAIQTGSDADQMGLVFYTHPSASNIDMAQGLLLDHAGNLTATALVKGTSLTLTGAVPLVNLDTVDGADNKRLIVAGAGGASVTRGAYFILHGNEYPADSASAPGSMVISSGTVTGSYIDLRPGGSQSVSVRLFPTGFSGWSTQLAPYFVTLGSSAARVIGMARRPATNAAGLTLTVTAGGASGGMISTADLTGGSGGLGYTAGDVLTLATPVGGGAGTITVDTVDGSGTILTFTITTKGYNYVVGVNATTGGTGTGAIINVATIESATDKNGGNLILTSGISTGTGVSSVEIQTYKAGTAGTTDNTPTTKMIVMHSGRVGIGTTSPGAVLDIHSLGTTTGLAFQIADSGGTGRFTVLDNGTAQHTPGVSSALTDYLINPTTKTSGNFLDLQINTVSKLSISYTGQIVSPLATGTSPFAVTSTTVNTNLNADMVDGFNANATPTASTILPLDSVKGFTGEKFRITPEGGYAVRLTNKTGVNSVKGTIVNVSTVTDNSFILSPAAADQPFGIVYESGIADGSECWIVVTGIADVLIADGTASTRAYWVQVSGTTAGRADITNASPVPATHWDEIGHCLESKASGTDVLAKCVIHFN